MPGACVPSCVGAKVFPVPAGVYPCADGEVPGRACCAGGGLMTTVLSEKFCGGGVFSEEPQRGQNCAVRVTSFWQRGQRIIASGGAG